VTDLVQQTVYAAVVFASLSIPSHAANSARASQAKRIVPEVNNSVSSVPSVSSVRDSSELKGEILQMRERGRFGKKAVLRVARAEARARKSIL
jgi:hypothetical protein